MYYFVEYMRAKAALRIALIILAVVFLAGVVVRIAVHGPTVYQWSSGLQSEPGAHVTRTQLPDGSVRVVVDNPSQRTHAVVIQGPGRLDMDITEPEKKSTRNDVVSMGNMDMNTRVHNGMAHTVIRYHGGLILDVGLLLVFSIPMGIIIGTILAGPLSKENDGHLELAWTKPVSREKYALAAIGVDASTIFISQLCAIAVALLGMLMFSVPSFTATNMFLPELLMAIFGPIAWYALVTAASTSVKRGPGVVIGAAWLTAIIVPAVSAALAGPAQLNSVARGFYLIFHTLTYLDPIAYLSIKTVGHETSVRTVVGTDLVATVWILIALSVGYIALSVLQWRRVEA
ncbi:MAG TPA: hypothetical protein VFE17_12675 [Candidatus Baltobacteraceae bacterium]|jgi:hypothetical protein|nr:hypothetical protein [Candidatus Baltobacteraceae bacterium]